MPQDIVITAYKFDELSPEAKEKARQWYREGNQYDQLSDEMDAALEGELEKAGITALNKPTVYYSLGYCQGDGACFIGMFGHDGYTFKVTHEGRYYHYNTIDAELVCRNTDGEVEAKEGDSRDVRAIESAFLYLCRAICRNIEKAGYAEIDHENSDANVDEVLRINDYLFTEAGKRCACL
jgi:hypothetical protein